MGWKTLPFLDEELKAVFWAIEIKSSEEEETFVSATALKLGRDGFVRTTWATSQADYSSSKDKFTEVLKGRIFRSGYKFEVYSAGIGWRIMEWLD